MDSRIGQIQIHQTVIAVGVILAEGWEMRGLFVLLVLFWFAEHREKRRSVDALDRLEEVRRD